MIFWGGPVKKITLYLHPGKGPASYQNGCCTGSHKLTPSINCRTYFNFLFSLKVILSHIKDLRDRMYKFECSECIIHCMSNYKNFRSCLVCKCIPTAHRRQSHVQLELLNFEANDYWPVDPISTAKSKETHKILPQETAHQL